MKTSYTLKHVPEEYGRDRGDPTVAGSLVRAVTAAGAVQTTLLQAPAVQKARREARQRVRQQYQEGRQKFRSGHQPRDTAGKFRNVLARLKTDLGDVATEELAGEIERANAAGTVGDYTEAREASAKILELVKDVDVGNLTKGDINNIRDGSAELGKLMAYLPLPQGDPNAKVRFSDLPPPVADLIKELTKRVDEKITSDDAKDYLAVLQSFMSGGRTMTADQMSSELSKLMRVLA